MRIKCRECDGSGVSRSSIGEQIPCPKCDSMGDWAVKIICDTCGVMQSPFTEIPEFQIVHEDFTECKACYDKAIAEGLQAEAEAQFLAYHEHRDAGFGIHDSRA